MAHTAGNRNFFSVQLALASINFFLLRFSHFADRALGMPDRFIHESLGPQRNVSALFFPMTFSEYLNPL